MANRSDMVTVWDGYWIREMDRNTADTEMRAGRVQIWDEHGRWSPFENMLYQAEFPFANIPTSVPTLTGLTPQSGPPGSQVVATGTNFRESSTIRFDTKTLNTTYNSPTELVGYIPKNMSLGVKSVVVRNADGDITGQLAFEVIAVVP